MCIVQRNLFTVYYGGKFYLGMKWFLIFEALSTPRSCLITVSSFKLLELELVCLFIAETAKLLLVTTIRPADQILDLWCDKKNSE